MLLTLAPPQVGRGGSHRPGYGAVEFRASDVAMRQRQVGRSAGFRCLLVSVWRLLVNNMHRIRPLPKALLIWRYDTPQEMYKLAGKSGIARFARINGAGRLNWGETLEVTPKYACTAASGGYLGRQAGGNFNAGQCISH